MPNNFYFNLFLMWCVFLAMLSPNWICFPVFVHYNISKMELLRAPKLHSGGGTDTCPQGLFVRNSMANNFYFNLFLMWCVFLAALSPKLNLLSHFCTLLYFKDGNHWSPLVPLWGEIDICAPELFCTKFNAEQLLFQTFFDGMRIFGSVKLQTKYTFPFLYIIIIQRWES